jgi:FkbM family methyltransferase
VRQFIATLARPIGAMLRRRGLEDRVKDSRLYDAYCRLAHPALSAAGRRRHAIARQLLGPTPLIFDIGAHNGSSGAFYRRLGGRVVCVEPHSASAARIRRRFAGCAGITVVEAAVSSRAGATTLFVERTESGLNTTSQKWKRMLETDAGPFGRPAAPFAGEERVTCTTLDALVQEFGVPTYIKIDVEGQELDVLTGLHRSVEWVSFEAFLHRFGEEVLACLALLHDRFPGTKFWFTPGEMFDRLPESWMDYAQAAACVAASPEPFFEVLAWRPGAADWR